MELLKNENLFCEISLIENLVRGLRQQKSETLKSIKNYLSKKKHKIRKIYGNNLSKSIIIKYQIKIGGIKYEGNEQNVITGNETSDRRKVQF